MIPMPQQTATKKPGNQARPLTLNEHAQMMAAMATIARMMVLIAFITTIFNLVAGAGFEPASYGLWNRAGASPVTPLYVGPTGGPRNYTKLTDN